MDPNTNDTPAIVAASAAEARLSVIARAFRWLMKWFLVVFVAGCTGNTPTAPTPPLLTTPSPVVTSPPVMLPPPAPPPLPVFPPTDPRFNMTLYRQLAHNAHDGPLQPLRRFSLAPRIYLRTVDEDGKPIDLRMLDDAARVLEESAAEMTGKFGLAGLERGTEHRMGQLGWLTVRWLPQASNPRRICGQAHVGADGGTLDLFPYQQFCGCDRFQVAPRTIRHELGHALGFWHTDHPHDLMHGGHWDAAQCNHGMSAREIYHASVIYERPIGSPAP